VGCRRIVGALLATSFGMYIVKKRMGSFKLSLVWLLPKQTMHVSSSNISPIGLKFEK